MSSQTNNIPHEAKSHAANKEVINETADKSIENKDTTTKDSNDETPANSSSSTNTMPDGNKTEKTAEPKARFRKSNLFINVEEANTFFNKKK